MKRGIDFGGYNSHFRPLNSASPTRRDGGIKVVRGEGEEGEKGDKKIANAEGKYKNWEGRV